MKAVIARASVWTDRQLVAAIDRSALQPAAAVIGEGVANIAGRRVTIVTGAGLGKLAAPISITLDDLRSGNLTDAQLAALAVATTPGSVTLSGSQNGKAVSGLSLSNLPSGVTLTGMSLPQTSPVFINASGVLDLTAGGSVYLQSVSQPQSAGATITIKHLSAQGDVTLQATRDIVAALDAEAFQIEATGNLTLAATGAIGSDSAALTYKIGGKLISAQSGDDLYLRARGADMLVGRVFATGVASLAAPDGAIKGYLEGVTVTAGSIILNAKGDIGAAAAPLQVRTGGVVSGASDEGSAYIASLQLANEASAPDLTVDSFTAAGSIKLVSDGDLTATSVSSTNGAIMLAAGHGVSVDGITITGEKGAITVTAVRALDVGANGLSAPGAITLNASGAATLAADGEITSRGATISLTAASLLMKSGSVISSAAGLTVDVSGALSATSLTSASGHIRATSGGDASFGSVAITDAAGDGAIALTSTGGTLDLASVTGPGAITLNASGAATLAARGQVTSRGATISLTSASLLMNSGSAMSSAAGLTLDIAGDLTATSLTSASGDIHATSGENAIFDNVKISAASGSQTITLTSTGGTLKLASVEGPGAITLNASGAATLAAGGQVTSHRATVDLAAASYAMGLGSTMSSATGLTLSTTGGLTAMTLTSGSGDIAATSGGNAFFDAVTITDGSGSGTITLKSTGGRLDVGSITGPGLISLEAAMGVLTATSLTSASGDILAKSGGNASFDTVAINATSGSGAITLESTGGTLDVGSVTGPGAIKLNASGAATLAAGGQITSRGATISLTAASLLMKSGSAMSASTDLTLDIAGDLSATSLTSSSGDILATSGGNASFDSVAITDTAGAGTITFSSTGGTLVIASVTGPGAITLNASGVATLAAGGNITSRGSMIGLTAASLLMKSGSAMSASTDLTLDIASALTATSLTSARGDILATSGGNASFDTVAITDRR